MAKKIERMNMCRIRWQIYTRKETTSHMPEPNSSCDNVPLGYLAGFAEGSAKVRWMG